MKKLYSFICGKYRKLKEKREKVINYMLNGKATIVLLKVGLIRIT